MMIFPVIFLGQGGRAKTIKNDTVYAGFKGGDQAIVEYMKVNYLAFHQPEKGKKYKVFAEVFLPEGIHCPEARISDKSSNELTNDDKIGLCNALSGGCYQWIYKTYNGKKFQTHVYYEINFSDKDIKVKQIKYNSRLGSFMHYEEYASEHPGYETQNTIENK